MEDSHISIDTLARDYPGLFDSFQQRGLANALYGMYVALPPLLFLVSRAPSPAGGRVHARTHARVS
jgi:hypothetical protein